MTICGTVLVVARIGLVIALAILTWASLEPIDRLPVAPNVSDKVLHLSAYAALGAVAALAQRRPRVIITVLLITVFGLLLEILQGRTGYRTFDLQDLLADAIGAAFGVLLVTALFSLGDRPSPRS